ncbi:hypothetical protein F4604DRAFT_1933894 [Suillus subluteus]|nr:hypothetical protein F4604DRAFT_1933894 [Suillus subluteus]
MVADFLVLEELTISMDSTGSILMPAIAHSILAISIYSAQSQDNRHLLFDLDYLSAFNFSWARLANVEIQAQELNALPHLLHLYLDLSSLMIHRNGGLATSLPNLRALEARYVRLWPYEEFKAFLTQSNHPPERLIFNAGVMTTDEQ